MKALAFLAFSILCNGQGILAPILGTPPPVVSPGIAFDTAVDGGLVNTGTSLTWSHTVTGSNPILFVGAFGNTVGADPTCAGITGATYNSVSMTQVTGSPFNGGADRCMYLFYLAGPATGTHSVVISASSSIVIDGQSASYTGARQTGIPDAHNTNAVGGTPISQSVNTVASSCWIFAMVRSDTGTPAAGAFTTLRVTSANGIGLIDSNLTTPSAGTWPLIASSSGATFMGMIIVSFAQF